MPLNKENVFYEKIINKIRNSHKILHENPMHKLILLIIIKISNLIY